MVMRVAPEELRLAGSAVDTLAAMFEATMRTLASTLDADEGCWGQDETGRAFARVYAPAAGNARQALSGLHDAVRGVGDALRVVADNVDAAEVRAQKRFG